MKNKSFKLLFGFIAVSLCICCLSGCSENTEGETSQQEISQNEEKPVNGVIKGTDGWLYYASTLGDYTGSSNASDRKIYNTAHNISLMQKFCEQQGCSFVFAVAPNKNSLYYENMPSQYIKNTADDNISRLFSLLSKENVNFTDLFSLFSESEDLLYLKTDSHWNNKGALSAFREMLDALKKAYKDYPDSSFSCEKREVGDLNKALDENSSEAEENYYYTGEFGFSYKTKTESAEEPLIITENSSASGRLVMFRDSFGNSLLPFMADNFSFACFSKGVPYLPEKFIELYSADYVIAEVAQRNVTDIAVAPPVFTGPERECITDIAETVGVSATVNIKESANAMDYMQIYGCITGNEEFSDVFVEVNGKCYEAFTVTDSSGDYSYLLYLHKNILSDADADVRIYLSSDGELIKASV